MRFDTPEAMEGYAAEFDAIVDDAALPDRFCTSSDWILPARTAFAASAPVTGWRFDEGIVALMKLETPMGRTLLPWEVSWRLAGPIAPRDPAAVARRLVEALKVDRQRWDTAFLSGLTRGGPLFTALVHAGQRPFVLGLGLPTQRCVASLEGGIEGFLSRRTPHFRKNLRRARRLAGEVLRFERIAPNTIERALEVYGWILEIEARSWKGLEGHGIQSGAMRTFYAEMLPRLAATGRLRVTLVHQGAERVGYVLGGVRAGGYRGLQISFDDKLSSLSVGNLLQLATIEGLCEEGVASYDLGSEMAYKRAWAEQIIETVPLVLR